MVLIGSVLMAMAITVQTTLLLTGFLSPLVLFLPGSFLTFAQGLALPYAQAGAMAVRPAIVRQPLQASRFHAELHGCGNCADLRAAGGWYGGPLVWITTTMMLCSLSAAFAALHSLSQGHAPRLLSQQIPRARDQRSLSFIHCFYGLRASIIS